MHRIAIKASIAIVALALVYFIPRLVLHYFEPSDPWASYFYMYGLGLLCFLIGILVITVSGSLNMALVVDRRWLLILFLGYFFFACLHAFWIYVSLSLPVKTALSG